MTRHEFELYEINEIMQILVDHLESTGLIKEGLGYDNNF